MSADLLPGLDGVAPQPGVAKPDPILVVQGVERSFGGLQAVDVAHLEVARGAITALIGPNGAGKTTLFNLLTGFDRPDAGTWLFDGQPLQGRRAHQIARPGMVRTFQLTKALGRMSRARQHAAGGAGPARRAPGRSPAAGRWRAQEARNRTEADDLLDRFGLATMRRRVRRHALGRPAQAAGDGPGPHGPSPGW